MIHFFKRPKKIKLVAPVDGIVISLDQVEDPIFSNRMMGEGIAIEPTGKEILAPANGVITMISRSNHAIGLTLDSGLEVLIHVGLNTSALNGQGFTPHIKKGQKVETGTLLLCFDSKQIQESGKSTCIPIILLNAKEYQLSCLSHGSQVQANQSILMEVF